MRIFASLLASSVAIVACSGTSSPDPSSATDGGAPSSEAPSDPGAFGVPGGKGADPSCASASYTATKAPLALGIMLDRSDSMLVVTSSGATKWTAAKNAIASFLGQAQGISVGLSYFPQRVAGVPASCTTNAQCGAAGPCGVHVCLQAGDPKACTTSAQCGGNPCVAVGKCTIADKLCLPTSADPCGPGGGTCRLWCENETACTVADYATPAVPIGPNASGANAKAAIASSLAATDPWGDTPTAPALAGALASAESFAASNAGFVPAVVLVTDGLPTDCGVTDPAGIAQIADFGKSRGVRTFVVGIFAPSEEASAHATLDAVAAAGGTGKALVVKTSTNVATELSSALEDVRKRGVPCDYAMPVPANGGVVDASKVNVLVTPKGAVASTVPWVDAESKCGDLAGWHYDASKAKIVLCPKTCDAVANADGVKVDIVTGCQTVVR